MATDNDEPDRQSNFWENNLNKVDEQIEEFFSDTSRSFKENYSELEQRVTSWFDNLELDDKADAEWKKLKSDSNLLKAKIENRANHLVQNGRIKLAEWTSSSSAN